MIFATITSVVLIINFKMDAVVESIGEQDTKLVLFRKDFFDLNIRDIINRKSLFIINYLGFTQGKIEEPRIVRIKDEENILLSNEKTIEIFSSTGKLIASKSIDQVLEAERIIDSCILDLNKDSCDEILLILGDTDKTYGKGFLVYSLDNGFKRVFYQSFEDMNPWKIQISDVDGDGNKEISITMFKETRFHPVMANRPYIYDWVDNSIFPKWRGSRLSKPFDDYIFQDIDGDGADELISIEILQNGNKIINSYKWKGFGFEGLVESNEYEDIMAVKRAMESNGKIHIYIKENDKNKWVALEYDGTRFIEQALIEN